MRLSQANTKALFTLSSFQPSSNVLHFQYACALSQEELHTTLAGGTKKAFTENT